MLCGVSILEVGLSLTHEKVAPGPLPEWLLDHIRAQSCDPRMRSKGGPSRVLVLYAGESARRENLERLADEGLVIDRTLHHTLESLEKSLLADLRMPRVLSLSGGWNLVLDAACADAAAQLEFPIMHPIPDLSWNRNKTRALATLHSVLAREGKLDEWEGAGIDGFSRVLRRLEESLGGTHPDFVTSRVIDGLNEALEADSTPFSLAEVEGIIMLDYSPVMPACHYELLSAISHHRPIHQLAYPGSHRLGEYGLLLQDDYAVKNLSDIPWVPDHEIVDISNQITRSAHRRYRLQRESHSIPLATRLIAEQLRVEPESNILIIDPTSDEDSYEWSRALADIGTTLAEGESMASSEPLGHWLSGLAGICHGPNAWSLENLRVLALQRSLRLFDESPAHPSISDLVPEADADLLTESARGDHLLGGAGALERWLVTLARDETDPIKGRRKEAAQWWLLSLAHSNQALLAEYDQNALADRELWRGCHSGQHLPVANNTTTADEWLTAALSRVDLTAGIEAADGSSVLSAAVVQNLVDSHSRLRRMQTTTGQLSPQNGLDWVEEFSTLISSTPIRSSGGKSRDNIRLMTPAEALGCTADLIILANVSSTSWDLRVPKVPFIGEEQRHELGILRPDGPIREARHHLHHLLSAARGEIIILDPSKDKSTPVAAPIREWAKQNSPDSQSPLLEESPGRENDARSQRWCDGNELQRMQPPSRTALNPSAITIPIDVEIQDDRERRQPRITDDEGYLPAEASPHIWAVDKKLLLRQHRGKHAITARKAAHWPVIGGDRRVSIDPRPLNPESTGSAPFDSRHGHLEGAGQSVDIWSASRLKEWVTCPRRGWLSRGLSVEEEERQREDLDSRVQGNLMHEVHHQMLERILGIEQGIERTIEEIENSGLPVNIASSGLSLEQLQSIALEELARLAPWLERTDAVSSSRLRSLTGFSREEWLDWLRESIPIQPAGRIGRMIHAEQRIDGTIPIATEWEALSHDSDGLEITLPVELTSPEQVELPALRMRGQIDRVDLLPFDEKMTLVDESGSCEIAPLRLEGSDWKPRRQIIIRDIKTSEGEPHKRHRIGLLEELQLALYARAWEVAHPGDLVVAVGISVIGHDTDHFLEVSRNIADGSTNLVMGDTRKPQTPSRYRFPDEDQEPTSDPFRAWLAQRLSTALSAAAGAAAGRVHPTPSKGACQFCSVQSVCNVRYKGDDR